MRSDARKRLAEEQDSEPCEDCGKPLNSFACKIRHINVSTEWAKEDH